MSRAPSPVESTTFERASSLRETIAIGIYEARPFTVAQTGGVMDVMRIDKVFAWADAQSFYRSECYDIADSVLARMLLSETPPATIGSLAA